MTWDALRWTCYFLLRPPVLRAMNLCARVWTACALDFRAINRRTRVWAACALDFRAIKRCTRVWTACGRQTPPVRTIPRAQGIIAQRPSLSMCPAGQWSFSRLGAHAPALLPRGQRQLGGVPTTGGVQPPAAGPQVPFARIAAPPGQRPPHFPSAFSCVPLGHDPHRPFSSTWVPGGHLPHLPLAWRCEPGGQQRPSGNATLPGRQHRPFGSGTRPGGHSPWPPQNSTGADPEDRLGFRQIPALREEQPAALQDRAGS